MSATRTPGTMAAYAASKRALLGDLSGTVLEIGAGRGANFGYFQPGIRWIGLEPDRRRRRALARTATASGRHRTVLAAPAERVPLVDACVDAVVGTIVLCSVRDQDRVLGEVLRVLRTGGSFVFFEHVAAPRATWSRFAQRVYAPLSRAFDHGCDPGRETADAIERAGFADVHIDRFAEPGPVGVRIPYIAGRARR